MHCFPFSLIAADKSGKSCSFVEESSSPVCKSYLAHSFLLLSFLVMIMVSSGAKQIEPNLFPVFKVNVEGPMTKYTPKIQIVALFSRADLCSSNPNWKNELPNC